MFCRVPQKNDIGVKGDAKEKPTIPFGDTRSLTHRLSVILTPTARPSELLLDRNLRACTVGVRASHRPAHLIPFTPREPL